MIGYNPSHLNKNETLLEAFHRVEAYLKANPQYQVYQSSAQYQEGAQLYTLNTIIVPEGSTVSAGDVVFFSNNYYSVITDVSELTFTVEYASNFRGPQGPQGPQGPKGEPGSGSNPNLFINSNFAINQRGQSEYTCNSKIYTVDRTYANRSVITPLQGGGIKLNVLSGQSNPYIQQIIENATPLVGKQLTFSISIDGLKYSNTITTAVPSADSTNPFYNKNMTFGNYTCNLQLVKYKPSSNPYPVLLVTFTIANPNNTIINCWKLEIGSVATEFSPPSIAEELPKCQRYYQIRSNSYTIETNAIDRPIPMRLNGTTGTTTIDSVTYKYVDAEL